MRHSALTGGLVINLTFFVLAYLSKLAIGGRIQPYLILYL